MNLESMILVVLAVLINVAFLTLLERKLLSGMQVRVGPNKVGGYGLLQPAADAIKLFSKEIGSVGYGSRLGFYVAPFLALGLMAVLCNFFPWSGFEGVGQVGALGVLLILSLNIYPLLMSGWMSNSNYAVIGGLRGVAQTISYEISLSFILLTFLVMTSSLSLTAQQETSTEEVTCLFPLVALLWGLSVLAELNRTPFDFAEGESELVSGFNIEYGATGFALLFMAEYGMISLLSVLTSVVLIKGVSLSLSLLIMGLVIWSRATYPRYRYDLLMGLAWKNILPWSLIFLEAALVLTII